MNTEDRAHSVLSPSFMHVALLCPGAVGLKESLPPEAPGAPAIKGTFIHAAGSDHLDAFLTHKITGEETFPVPITNPETEKVVQGWRDIIWEKAFEKSVTGKVYGIEERLIFSEKFSLWGTTDFWLVGTDERAKPYGMVCDLKTGFVYVDAEKNPQLAAYACSLRKTVRDQGKDLDYVRAAIYQPFGEGEKWRETKFTGKQLDNWERKFLKLASEVFSGKAKFKAGEHCQYCPAGRARGVCSTYDAFRTKETGLKLLDPADVVFPIVEQIPTDMLVKIRRHEKALDTFVKGCSKELLRRKLAGEVIADVKLVEAKTRRKWDELQQHELDKLLSSKYGMKLYEVSLRGLTDVKDELSAQIGKKESEELLKPFLVTPKGGIVLADASDSREEVKPTHNLFTED